MFLRIIFWLAALVAIAALGQQILTGSGYLLIVLPNNTTSIQMSFWLGIGLVFASWLVIIFSIKLLSFLSQPLVGIKRQLAQKKLLKSNRLTLSGLEDLTTGNWKTAKKKLVKAAKRNRHLINLVAAANAAYLEGKPEESSRLLQEAEKKHPKSKISVELSQVRMHLDQRQYEQALASLVRLNLALPKNKLILRLLAQLRCFLQDFEPLLDLLKQTKKQQVFSPEEQAKLELEAYQGYFTHLNLTDQPEKLDKAKSIWANMPANLVAQEQLILIWLNQLVSVKQLEEAEQLLTTSLKNSWSASLITQLGLLPPSPNCKKHLVLAQNWLKKRPNDPELLHCLGRINQKLKRWEIALDYYLASQKLTSSHELNLEIALLYTALGKLEDAKFFNQQAVQAMQKNLSPLPLP